ncbi:hypothetical protein RvY_13399-2 [Ramazzottius varieornatus]|nr:hypothetical protein RvY_13399-2 [Ramazzottius varieornatus]
MAVPPLQQLLITNYGWRESCIFIGFLTILIGLCALLLPSHQLQAAGTNEKVTFAKSANLSLFRDIPFYILMLHPFLMSGLMIYGFLPFRFVTDILEINEQGATSIIGVGGFTDMVARLLTVAVSATPWVSGRITRFNIAHVMTLLSVVCLFLFTWSTTLVALAAWSGALSFFLAIKWCMWPGLQMEMFGSNRFCTSFSYGSFVQGIGSLIFPPLGSMVAR